MGDHFFAYVLVIFFGVCGIRVLTIGISGFLLYHKKVQATAKSGEKYERHPHKHIGKYGARPKEDIGTTKAVFTYEENGKQIKATAVNLVGNDNTTVVNGAAYTIKVSPFDPHKCYLPALQIYRGYGFIAKIFIFVFRLLPRLGGLMFLGIAWITYTNFIRE